MRTKTKDSPFLQKNIISGLRSWFCKIPDSRAANKSISLDDALMSLFSVFFLKFSSLLQWEKSKEGEKGHKSNLTSLFEIKKIPSDTQVRKIIDKISPESLLPLFGYFFRIAQRGGKLLQFEFMNIGGKKHYLVPIDGTQYFSSKKVHCQNCLKKEHRNGTTTWHHQILIGVVAHPEESRVLPISAEPITGRDGNKKYDCEYVAAKRLLSRLHKEHPKLGMIICGDALYARGDLVRELRGHGMSYILNVKEKGNPILFRIVNERERHGEMETCEYEDVIGEKIKKTRTRKFRFTNNVPMDNASSTEFLVNFVECWETVEWVNSKGKKQKKSTHFSWVTNIKANKNNVEKIMKGGRSRWRVENETINALKNQGYNFEHNYGHGDENLSINSAILMILAFSFDQVLELGNERVKEAMKISRKLYIRKRMLAIYMCVYVESWEDLWHKILQVLQGKLDNTS